MKSEDYGKMVTTIRADLQELLQAVKDDPAEVQVVQKCGEASEEAFELADHIRSSLGGAMNDLSLEQSDSIRRRLRSCVKRMISRDLLALAQDEKNKSEESHLAQARFREHIKVLLAVGIFLNVVLAIFVSLVFSKRITGRLRVLVDNSFRLASGLPLQKPVGGKDEITEVDISFHNMADALANAKQKERSLIDHSLDVICSLDQNRRFTAANPACHTKLGYSEEQLLGRNFHSLLADGDVERFEKSMSSAQAEKVEAKFETQIKHNEGNEICLDWSVHWVPFEKLFFCVGHDISERKEIERLKQEFMGMITHDLRTPLTVVKGYLEMSEAGVFGELNEIGKRQLSNAERNTDRMLGLDNDLLDIEKSETGQLQLHPSEVYSSELLDQCVNSLIPLAQRQEIHLDAVLTNLILFADQQRVSQVLVNLVSNAIKFSPKKGTVKLWAEDKEGMAIIYVSDQGRGIPEHMREAVFERFRQVEAADAVLKGGTGLGLAICKVIVELHGGNIKVENNNGSGCTFSFSLPLAKSVEVSSETTLLK
jgi:PAS domain S-box-containing protein